MRASEHILKIIESYRNAIAQVDAETHRKITFDEIQWRCIALKGWFLEHDLGRGNTIGLMSSNNVDFIWILLSIWSSGAACHLFSPRYTLREVIYSLGIAPVDCLVMQKGDFRRLNCSETSRIKHILEFGDEKTQCSEGAIAMDAILRDFQKDNPHIIKHFQTIKTMQNRNGKVRCNITSKSPDDVALILTSSGSTGPPKCVMLTHDNIIAALKLSHLFVEKNAIALGLMPYCHSYGLITMLMCLCEGAFIVNMASFSFFTWINTIKEFSVSHLHIVPSLSLSLLKSDSVNFQDLQSVRHIWLAAAPVCEKANEELRKKFFQPVRIYKSYGLTETTYITIVGEFEFRKPGSLGKVVETMQCKIIDKDSRKDLSRNVVGEVCFKGPMVAQGYVNNPKATAEAIDRDGWVRTGDLGYFDEDGYFYYVDRMKNIIKYQGQQVSPCELETVLISRPDIREAAVIGMRHKIYGEVPRAFIVPQDHFKIIAQDIHDYIKEMVAPFKQLRGGIVFLTKLPKIGPGKVDRSLLRSSKPDKVFYDETRERSLSKNYELESCRLNTDAGESQQNGQRLIKPPRQERQI